MRRTTSAPDAAPESALARLLEVESRLEAMLEEARVHADDIESEARERAGLRAGALEGELAAADTELSAALAAEAEARIARERALLAEARARYDAVDAAGLAAHADWVVEQVLRMASEGSP